MLDIKNQILKNRYTCFLFTLNNPNNTVLDKIASYISKKRSVIIIKKGNISDYTFLIYVFKINQLCALYDSILIIQDRFDIVKITDSQGIYLTKDSIDYKYLKTFLDNSLIIATDGTYAHNCDFIVADIDYQDKITYILNSKNATYSAISEDL